MRPVRLTIAATAAALLAAALPAVAGTGPTASSPGWRPHRSTPEPGHTQDPANLASCDPIDPAQCLLPYPNDWFTRHDPSSRTHRRLDLSPLAMPRNREGKPIEPQEWNRSDGFSAGSQLLAYVPGMTRNADLAPSKLPPITDLARYADPDAGVVLLDPLTGKRWPVWAEVDQYTAQAVPNPGGTVQQDLVIHPSVNLQDGHRYVVALRHLVGDDGKVVPPSPAFRAYRDGAASPSDPRRAHMEDLFSTLQQAGVARRDLYLAWDFTTASTENVTGRLLAVRDDALRRLGDDSPGDGRVQGSAPVFTVEKVTDLTPTQDDRIARRVTGHFTVPCYIAPTCDPPAKCDTATQGTVDDCPMPGQFALDPGDPDAVPRQTPGQTYQANFICNVPRVAFDEHRRLRPVEYGHGLFGGAGEVDSSPQKDMAQKFGMLYCATDWYGMATADVPNALIALHDLSRFPFLTDRVQQGELDFLYLARLMVHPQGFSADKAFQWADGRSFIDTRQAFYDGNSQGGIYGGTVCAVSVDVRRCVLGVPGMDYSVLLPRSSDYVASKPLTEYDPTQLDPGDPTGQLGYSDVFDLSYPDQAQRMLVLDLIQTLWDRSDPNGYATHLTGGLPGTPHHHVLLQVGWGDHQVANITAFTEARSIGAKGLRPPLVSARYGPYVDPYWGIPGIESFPYDGSAVTLFDTGPVRQVAAGQHNGTDPPPTADVPNRSGEDPHEAPRRAPCGQQQKADFLRVGGLVTDPCGAPYFAWDWTGH